MGPWTEILAGVENGWRLLFSVPPVPMARRRVGQNAQLAIGVAFLLALCSPASATWWLETLTRNAISVLYSHASTLFRDRSV